MIDDSTSLKYLEKHLARTGQSVGDLVGEASSAFGEIKLVGVAGSLMQGFGNSASSLDLLILVDGDEVTDFPVPSFSLDVPIYPYYLNTGWAREAGEPILAGQLPTTFKRAEWQAGQRAMMRLGRIALGNVLAADPEWLAWRDRLRLAFSSYAVTWWRAEALRRRTAARILAEDDLLLATQRYCDAGLAILESVAAACGEAYVGSLWIGGKIERIGNPEYTEILGRLLQNPTTVDEARGYQHDVEEILAALTRERPLPDDPTVVLTYQADVRRWLYQDKVLLHKWSLTGVEFDAEAELAADEDGVIWAAPASELHGLPRLLATEGLVWLSVIEGDRVGTL